MPGKSIGCAILVTTRIDSLEKKDFLTKVPPATIGLLLTEDPDERGATATKLRESQQLILRLLADGPMSSAELERRVLEKVGCSIITVKRARSQLNVITRKREFNGEWFCDLPRCK